MKEVCFSRKIFIRIWIADIFPWTTEYIAILALREVVFLRQKAYNIYVFLEKNSAATYIIFVWQFVALLLSLWHIDKHEVKIRKQRLKREFCPQIFTVLLFVLGIVHVIYTYYSTLLFNTIIKY